MNKCCKCENDGPVILNQDSYCEEHACETTEAKKDMLLRNFQRQTGYLDWMLEKAIAAATEGK